MIRILLTSFLIGFGGIAVQAQQLLEQSSRSSILIGEPVLVKYIVKTAKGDKIVFTEKVNAIEAQVKDGGGSLTKKGTDFELITPFRDSLTPMGASKKWIGEYALTAWEEGEFILPGPEIIINDSTYRFKDLTIKVNLVAQKKDVDLYGIREHYAEIPIEPISVRAMKFLERNWWWIAIVVVALILGWLIARRRRWDRELANKKIDKPLTLKVRTIMAVEALDKSELWKKDQLKEHFVELSYILRAYLTSRYGISLLDKTTEQTKILLTQQGLNDETVDVIARILSQSDMVKFAKSQPDVIAILRQSTLVKQIIAETSPLDFDHVD
jgi:hypothetical protein